MTVVNLESNQHRRVRCDRGLLGSEDVKGRELMVPLAQVTASGQAPTLVLYEDIIQYDAAQWDFLPLSMHLINLVSE